MISKRNKYFKKYYIKNKKKLKKLHLNWYYTNKEKVSEYRKKYYLKNKDRTLSIRAKWNREIRKKILLSLGNKCVKCGFSDWRALQVDHVKGGGVSEIKRIGGTKKYWNKILKNKNNEYQLLCANCNWIKRHEDREFITRKTK